MKRPVLILFDIDGTLLLTRGAGREAMRCTLEDVFGTSAGLDEVHFGGKTDWQLVVELLTPLGYSYDDIAAAMPKYDRVMGEHLARIITNYEVSACPGALELVDELHARSDVLLALVTGNCQSSAPVKLQAAGFDPSHFPVGAFGSESVERDHLPPLALARAIEHYRQDIALEQVVVIGDTPADVRCARALGVTAIAVRTGFCQPGELEACLPDHLLDDLTTFAELLAL